MGGPQYGCSGPLQLAALGAKRPRHDDQRPAPRCPDVDCPGGRVEVNPKRVFNVRMTRQPFRDRIRLSSVPAIIAVMLSLPLCGGCEEYTTNLENPAVNPPPGNLIPNGSFEQNGQATLDTWQVSNSSLASLAPQAAPGGGKWSLRLEADGAPSTGQVKFPVPGLKDGDIVRLSAYVRASDESGGGLVGVEVTSADGRVRKKSFASTADTRWTQVGVTETLSLETGDNVWVVLTSPPTELRARAGLFDLVTLERLGK
jgi:hypothetical protein